MRQVIKMTSRVCLRILILLETGADTDLFDSVDHMNILEEIELEPAFEGFLIHDLRRKERPVGDLPFNGNSLTFPIPQREMDVNTLLVQNLGYTG